MRHRLFALFLIAPALAACEKTEPVATTTVEETAGAEGPEEKVQLDGTTPGDLIPMFTASGTTGGKPAAVASQTPGAVTVYCVGSTTCPTTKQYAAKLREIETGYAPKGVQFVWLYSNRAESDEEKTAWHAEKGLAGVFVIDRDAAIAKALGAERTPELVLTAANGTITYRGAIDDGSGDPKRATIEYLRNALDATLAGKPVEVSVTVPDG